MEDDIPQEDKATLQKKSLLTNPTLMGWLTIIGLPLGLWGIYLSFAFNKEARPTFKVLSDVEITGSQPNSKIKVIYDSVQVQNVRAVTITLWNAGNDFISKEAFSKDKPITIECSKPVSILDFNALAISRSDLKFTATYYVDDVAGTPTDTTSASSDYVALELQGDEGFEAGDGATFSILYTTNAVDCQWHVDARIKGIPKGFTGTIGSKYFVEILVNGVMTTLTCLFLYIIGSRTIWGSAKNWWISGSIGSVLLLFICYVINALVNLYPISIEPPRVLLP